MEEQEMLRTFNCGIGMVAVVPTHGRTTLIDHCVSVGIEAWTIGAVASTKNEPRVVFR
jgi:phosphoribosylformylglycinamidine cyclo-ligase